MARTTITLKDQLLKKLNYIAEQKNRSIPNLIETILLRYLDEDLYVDDFEMEDIRADLNLKKSIRAGLSDYKAGRGKIV